LLRVRDYLAAIVENSADAIVTADLEGRIISWNRGAEELYGHTAEEMIGMSVFDLYPEELKKERKKWIKLLLEKGALRNIRTRIYNKQGKLVDIILSLSLLRDEKGNPIATVGISKDISREAELEEKLREHAKQLEEKNKEVESFLYAISHDLKAPIISVQGYASALLSDYGDKLDEEARFYLERIKKNTELMDNLITDLLELSRVGRITQPYEEVDLSDVLKDLCHEYTRKYRGLRIEIKALPRVRCEKNRIIQVFSNLIDNAAKYMGEQEEPLVEVGCEDMGKEWRFYVRDNGVGIPEEYLGKVFQPFHRVPQEKTRSVDGTGLGLAIVKKIVEYHKGRVWAESEPGKGSTFYFTLPK
jgi:PAS domain S-box-containing protein